MTHLGSLTPRAIHPIVLVANVIVFGGAAAVLAWTGRHDRRAVHLGVFFLLVAVSFANGLTTRLAPLAESADQLRLGLLALHPDAFLPWYLWRFVRQFPRLPRGERGPRVERLMITASLAAGVLLFVASLWSDGPLSMFAWGERGTWFDAVMFGLAIPALPFGLWKARRADVREQRRYTLFVTGLAVGFLPMAAQVFAEATWRPYTAFIDVPPRRLLVGLVLYPLLLSIPVTTAYAVLVHRVMDVKVLVRRAVQYALARFTIVGLAAAPAALLAVTLVRNRDQTIGELVTTLIGDVHLGAARRAAGGAGGAAAAARTHRPHVLPRGGRHAHPDGRPGRVHAVAQRHARGVVPLVQRAGPRHAAPGTGRRPGRRCRHRAAALAGSRLRPLALDSGLATGLATRPDAMIDRARPGQWLGPAPAARRAAVARRRRRPRADAAAVGAIWSA